MKKICLFSLVIFLSGAATFALAADILAAENGTPGLFPIVPQPSSTPEQNGSQANQVHSLSNAERAKLAKFVNANLPPHWIEIPRYSVVESGGASVGGGKRDFLVLLDISGRGYSNTLLIYSRDSAGIVDSQEIDGWNMGNFKQMVRDLNGDGEDELMVPIELDWPPGSWTPTTGTPTWPAVYRLRNGRYVEDSRDFTNYYDTKVLPQLDQSITTAEGRGFSDALAISILEKNKILRVLGRNPVAGLNQAYQWMNSDDPTLMQCAIATFGDIGGHEKEVRTLQQSLPAAITHEIETRNGG